MMSSRKKKKNLYHYEQIHAHEWSEIMVKKENHKGQKDYWKMGDETGGVQVMYISKVWKIK